MWLFLDYFDPFLGDEDYGFFIQVYPLLLPKLPLLPSGPYSCVHDLIATFTLKLFIILQKNEEVVKIEYKLFGNMWEQFAWDRIVRIKS